MLTRMHSRRYLHCVPATVRLRAEELFEGSGAGDDGWKGVLSKLDCEIAAIESDLREPAISEERASALRRQRRQLLQRTNELRDEIAAMERLTILANPDLERLYALLATNLHDDERIWEVIFLAVGARRDYSSYRDNLKSARENAVKIATKAVELAELLDWYAASTVQAPDEFWSTKALLGAAMVPEENAQVWQQVRHQLLGNEKATDDTEEEGGDEITESDGAEELPDIEILEEGTEDGVSELQIPETARLSYAWSVAPSPSDLLQVLADAATRFQPAEFGHIGAAIASRKNNAKYAYLRALATLLNDNGIPVRDVGEQAIAITATIVISESEMVVTADDVHSALA